MQTLLLDQAEWDLTTDAVGNIAIASNPYSLAQDSASEIRVFQGEEYYNTNAGIPYWSQILGHWPPVSLMKAYFVAAAKLTPGVVKAQCFITSIDDRDVTGQVQIFDENGIVVSAANFGPPPILPPPAPSLNYVNNGGVLVITAPGWPTSPVALKPGAFWSNGSVAMVVTGSTPDPDAPPIYFGEFTAAQLLSVGGADLPVNDPGSGTGALFINGGVVCIA
jgi:hypothetical protein